MCWIQGAKCVKCNGPHKSEHHREFGWCCKANAKTNPPRLETKKGKPCPHTFKCSNCKGDYQADSNTCSFWRHHFNREWHAKKYAKICENRSHSICSEVNSTIKQWLYEIWRFFTKCLQEFPCHKHYTRNTFSIQCNINSGTTLVRNTKNSKLLKLQWWTSSGHLSSSQLDCVYKTSFKW